MNQFFLKPGQKDCKLEHLLSLHPNMITVLGGIRSWFNRHNKILVVTSIFRPNSSTHADYRAIDIRTKDLTYDECLDLYTFLIEKYSEYSAFNRHGKRVLIAHFKESDYKKISWDHFHVQVQRTIVDR